MPEIVRLVVLAVVAYTEVEVSAVEDAYGNVFAAVAVEVMAPVMLSAPPNALVPVVVKLPTTVEEACERMPLAKVPSPVKVLAPVTASVPVLVVLPVVRVPIEAVLEKSADEDAVVAKKVVDVALASVVFPVTESVPATARFPAESKVLVAVLPNAAEVSTEKRLVDALPSVVRPVTESVPEFVVSANAAVPVKVGLAENTAEPVPVSSVSAEMRFADDGVASQVAMPVPSPEIPVETGRPVALVSVTADGVPKLGVTSVGDVPNTSAPEPVSSSISAASSDEASMSFSMRMLETPVRVSSSARVSMDEVETLLLKMDQSDEVRKPFVEAEAAWPLV